MTGTTLWHDINHSWLSEDSEPPSLTNDLLIETIASFVSTGTERLAIRGELPEDADHSMSVPYMQGSFTTSFTYGYSLVGKVINTTTAHSSLRDKIVHVMHPHATHANVSADAVTEIPPSLNVHRALLISSMETVVNACWDSGVTLGDRVVIFGFGLIGNLLASVIRLMPGVDPVIIDHDPQRLEAARRSGYSTTDNIGATAFDIAFNTTASSRALQQAIDITATDGRVIELSWYGNRAVELQLGSAFHHGRKRIISSQVSRIPQHVSARHDYASRKTLCITLLLDTNISLADSNCHTLPFNAAPAHFNALRQQAINLPAAILEY